VFTVQLGEVASNVAVSGTVYCAGVLTFDNTGGPYTVTTTSSTLRISTGTFDTDGITWNTVEVIGGTITINSLLTAATITSAVTYNFAGTAGFTCATFSHTGVSVFTVTFKESVTYTITTLLSCYLSRVGSIILFTSAHASTKANLTLVNGADCKLLANMTRIDASGGRVIRSFNGTITDCTNVVSITDLQTVGSSF